MVSRSPFLISKKILDGKDLYGVVAKNQGKEYKIKINDLLGLLVCDNRTFLIDVKGSDNPATLAVVNESNKYYFRSIKDTIQGNNFNQLPTVQRTTVNHTKTFRAL